MQIVDANADLADDFQMVYQGEQNKVKSMIDKLATKLGT
eukprot:CAMPEP_0185598236 /NCGR_PEP_ID=MMETSP0434-20130131/81875_1 /TAXON_ID=626734 ORGANISM="Favella taraikaensis, Strain Fe Narragansett Bay" /NCGR_SAMPLE_ID=MMETSP0434 /ASSEMBLY_ACC=CAM_ASM_000379 /LENGTH=38 /DNA_ID= /DNA_START= /DNA_END= /DNA_ORIENTATION=